MLQHVSVEIRPNQIDACVAFWKVLGFEQMTPPPILRDHVTWVQRNGTQIHFLYRDEPKVTDQGHGAVVVEDYEGTLAKLAAGAGQRDVRGLERLGRASDVRA